MKEKLSIFIDFGCFAYNFQVLLKSVKCFSAKCQGGITMDAVKQRNQTDKFSLLTRQGVTACVELVTSFLKHVAIFLVKQIQHKGLQFIKSFNFINTSDQIIFGNSSKQQKSCLTLCHMYCKCLVFCSWTFCNQEQQQQLEK